MGVGNLEFSLGDRQMNFKRFFAWIAVIALAICMLPVGSFRAKAAEGPVIKLHYTEVMATMMTGMFGCGSTARTAPATRL